MNEADLRRHLERQLDQPVGAVTLNDLRADDTGRASLAAAAEDGVPAVIVDALTADDLRRAGDLVLAHPGPGPVFVVGSGGLASGIAAAQGHTRHEDEHAGTSSSANPCLAVSGSCSPVTSEQIQHALDQGWRGVHLDLASSDSNLSDIVPAAVREAISYLQDGHSVVVHTFEERYPRVAVDVATVGSALAQVVTGCSRQVPVRRVLVAGGDTSGHVITSLGATALRSKTTIGPTLLCELESPDPVVNGLEVVLKGGQIGTVDFFEQVRRGDGAASSST